MSLRFPSLLLGALLLIAVAAKVAQKLPGVGPNSFDYLLGANTYKKSNQNVIFLDYELDQSVIQSYLNDGKTVICYVSVGSWEDWRADKAQFPASVLGKDYDGWPGEKWLDVRQIEILRPIMKARFKLAQSKGCQGIDPDNMNGYTVDTGFSISSQDQLKFNKAMSNEIHNLGMMAGLKNDNEQAADLVQFFDFAVLEACAFYDECHYLDIFIQNKKPVYAIEYTENWTEANFKAKVCPLVQTTQISFILKKLDLHDDYIVTC